MGSSSLLEAIMVKMPLSSKAAFALITAHKKASQEGSYIKVSGSCKKSSSVSTCGTTN